MRLSTARLMVLAFGILLTQISVANAAPCWLCLECYIAGVSGLDCFPSERCTADNTSVTSNIKVETCDSSACSCVGIECPCACSDEAECTIEVNNTQKYSFSASATWEQFGIGSDWEDELFVGTNCHSKATVGCEQKAGKKGGRKETHTRKWGTEDCRLPWSDQPYDTTLKEVTGCYVKSYTPACN